MIYWFGFLVFESRPRGIWGISLIADGFREGDPEFKGKVYNYSSLKLRDRNNLDQSIYHIEIVIDRAK
jgi:hypothetical protein